MKILPDLQDNRERRSDHGRWKELRLMLQDLDEQLRALEDQPEVAEKIEEAMASIRAEMSRITDPTDYLFLGGKPILNRLEAMEEMESFGEQSL